MQISESDRYRVFSPTEVLPTPEEIEEEIKLLLNNLSEDDFDVKKECLNKLLAILKEPNLEETQKFNLLSILFNRNLQHTDKHGKLALVKVVAELAKNTGSSAEFKNLLIGLLITMFVRLPGQRSATIEHLIDLYLTLGTTHDTTLRSYISKSLTILQQDNTQHYSLTVSATWQTAIKTFGHVLWEIDFRRVDLQDFLWLVYTWVPVSTQENPNYPPVMTELLPGLERLSNLAADERAQTIAIDLIGEYLNYQGLPPAIRLRILGNLIFRYRNLRPGLEDVNVRQSIRSIFLKLKKVEDRK